MIFKDADLELLLAAFIEGKPGVDTGEAEKLVRWAESVMIQHGMLLLILSGRLKVTGVNEDGVPVVEKWI